jgi:regulator of sirC expression with transglutaminase-like and TPR domain
MELSPQEQSVLRRFNESRKSPVSVLLRSSIYSIALAGLFLYLAVARNEPLYAVGVFGMFVLYLAIRIYSARRVAGIMPRILQRYESRIAELEGRLRNFEQEKSSPTKEG